MNVSHFFEVMLMALVYNIMILALLFASGSVIGWTIEVFYRQGASLDKSGISQWTLPAALRLRSYSFVSSGSA